MGSDSFARFVSLACHDLRTPLATVSGFAHTLRQNELGQPADRYVEMIQAASGQIADILDDLGLAARIEAGLFSPNIVEADTLELAQAAAGLVDDKVAAEGTGAESRSIGNPPSGRSQPSRGALFVTAASSRSSSLPTVPPWQSRRCYPTSFRSSSART